MQKKNKELEELQKKNKEMEELLSKYMPTAPPSNTFPENRGIFPPLNSNDRYKPSAVARALIDLSADASTDSRANSTKSKSKKSNDSNKKFPYIW